MTIVQRSFLQNNSPNRAFASANAFSFHIDLFAKLTKIHDLCKIFSAKSLNLNNNHREKDTYITYGDCQIDCV